MHYIQIAEDENDERIEIPCEEDNTVLLSTISAQFPGACGLKYRNPESQLMRAVRIIDGLLHPPDDNWGDILYIVVYPKDNKRKMDDTDQNQDVRSKRPAQKCSDLIVLGLPWKTTSEELKHYFQQYGELALAQVKGSSEEGKSKGYGFIKFMNYDVQQNVLAKKHQIGGRWCDVKIPHSKHQETKTFSNKIYVGRLTEDITEDHLHDYFSRYGEIIDVFKTKPFRPFAFVTFVDAAVANSLCGEDHIINGVSVCISSADPKPKGNDREGYGQRSSHLSGDGRMPPQPRFNNAGYNNNNTMGLNYRDQQIPSSNYREQPPMPNQWSGPPNQNYGDVGSDQVGPNQFNVGMPQAMLAAAAAWNQMVGMFGNSPGPKNDMSGPGRYGQNTGWGARDMNTPKDNLRTEKY